VLTEKQIQWIIFQVLLGLKFMHSGHVIHRDLKPSNILINSNNVVKICDFGLARGISMKNDKDKDVAFTEYVVTRWYRAPEVMVNAMHYDYQIDMWAVGCILGELLERQLPLFRGNDYLDQLKVIVKVIGTPSEEDMGTINSSARSFIANMGPQKRTDWKTRFAKSSPEALDLLDKLLVFNPKKRLTIDEALEHPYFKPIEKKRPPKSDLECKTPFKFDWEESLTRDKIQELMWEEIGEFRPAIREAREKAGLIKKVTTDGDKTGEKSSSE